MKLLMVFSALIVFCFALILFSFGCSGGKGGEAETIQSHEDEHAGHNHGPGEHHDIKLPDEGVEIPDWCVDHAVPESQCTKCNPELITHFKETGEWCAPHDLPESLCRLCNPDIEFPQESLLKPKTNELISAQMEITLLSRPYTNICATNDALIQFASSSTVKKAGLTTQQINSGLLETAIEAPAEVVFAETKMSVITSTVPALVSKWLVSPGERVRIDDILAVVQSPGIAELEAELVKAAATYNVHKAKLNRHIELKKKNIISDSDYEMQDALTLQAHAEFTSIKGLLRSAGMHKNDIESVINSKTISNQFFLRTLSDGVVVQRIAQIGKLLEAGEAFAIIADPRALWIEAQLTEQKIRHIEVGQVLTFSSDGRGLNRVGAKVIWVSQYLDPHSRTGIVRASVIDPLSNLQAGEVGIVNIIEKHNTHSFLVPKDAIQWEGCCNVVFVKESETRYRPKKVNLLGSRGDYYQIEGNIQAGDEVIVKGSFLLKTELKKTSIGAGCCGLEPVG